MDREIVVLMLKLATLILKQNAREVNVVFDNHKLTFSIEDMEDGDV